MDALGGVQYSREFQPTLPARGATVALLSGRNSNQFQPTLPARGATLAQPVREPQRKQFQPTLPARGAT